MKIKCLAVLVAVAFLAGCEERHTWVVQSKPITQEERDAIAAEEAKILSNVPNKLQLQGHDQEWYRIVDSAHQAALETCCQPRLFEYVIPAGTADYSDGYYSGKWKPYTQVP